MDTIITNNDFEFSNDDYLNKPYYDREENLNSIPDISSDDSLIFINTEEDD